MQEFAVLLLDYASLWRHDEGAVSRPSADARAYFSPPSSSLTHRPHRHQSNDTIAQLHPHSRPQFGDLTNIGSAHMRGAMGGKGSAPHINMSARPRSREANVSHSRDSSRPGMGRLFKQKQYFYDNDEPQSSGTTGGEEGGKERKPRDAKRLRGKDDDAQGGAGTGGRIHGLTRAPLSAPSDMQLPTETAAPATAPTTATTAPATA